MRILVSMLLVAAALATSAHATNAGIADKHVDLIGQVTTTDGKAVADATVIVYTAHPKSGLSAYCPSCYPDCSKKQHTDRSGRFKVPALADWLKFNILVVKDGFDATFANDVDPSKGILRVTIANSVPDNSYGVVGAKLVDQQGKPLIGATVRAYGEGKGSGMMFGYAPDVAPVAISDSQGYVRFFPKADVVRLLVIVSARDHAQLVTTWRQANGETLEQVHLQAGTTINGTLRDEAGRGLSGVAMHLEGIDKSVTGGQIPLDDEIATDDQGRFTFPNMPEGTEYQVAARMDSLGPKGLAGISGDFMTEESGTTTTIDVKARPAVSIDGEVVLSDGEPISDKSTVNLSRGRLLDSLFTQLDAQGRFHFDGVPLGENIELNVAVKGYKLQQGAFAKTTSYLLHAALARGDRHFTITLDPVGK